MSAASENRAVSVVVPVYNREVLLVRALDSVLAQTYRPVNLIVVDNNSTDGSLDVARRWADAHRSADFRVEVLQEPTPGAAAARARGLEQVITSQVMFFDSDDAMRPELLARAMEAFAASPGCRLVNWRGCGHRLDGASFATSYTDFRGLKSFLEYHIIHCQLTTNFFMADTELLRSCGGWDPQVRVWDDWELGIRLLLRLMQKQCSAGAAVEITACAKPRAAVQSIPEVLVDQYVQEVSITGTDYSSKADRLIFALERAEADFASLPAPEVGCSAGVFARKRIHWLRMMLYRRAMLAAAFRREGRPDLEARLYPALLDAVDPVGGQRLLNPVGRMLLRAAYAYARRGGRGAGRVLSRLL